MIGADVRMGTNVRIFNEQLVNVYGCELGDDTFVGPFVEITAGVKIGRRCKIESHAFVCDGVTLEDDVFIGHGTMFVNDLYPRVDRQVDRRHTLVSEFASVGSNATIIGGITIGRFAVIGAGAVVTHNVAEYSIVAGNPATVRRQFATADQLLQYMEDRQHSKHD